jgi:hypothetical protein
VRRSGGEKRAGVSGEILVGERVRGRGLSYLTLTYAVLRCSVSSYITLFFHTSAHLILPHPILSHPIPSYLTSSHPISSYLILSYLISSCVRRDEGRDRDRDRDRENEDVLALDSLNSPLVGTVQVSGVRAPHSQSVCVSVCVCV